VDRLTPAELELLEKNPKVGLISIPALLAVLAGWSHVEDIKARQRPR